MLLFTAKADGAMRAAELAVITKLCVQITKDTRLTSAMLKDVLECMGRPTITAFVRTYNSLRRQDPTAAARAAAGCKAIIATQKTIHQSEQAVLDALAAPLPKTTAPPKTT